MIFSYYVIVMHPKSKVYALRTINGIGKCSLHFIKINKQIIICVNSRITGYFFKTLWVGREIKRNEIY